MDLALMAMRKLKKEGKLEDMEQSDESFPKKHPQRYRDYHINRDALGMFFQ